jgi:hypothetical protein
MSKEEMITWIDNASYEQLLFKWRFAPIGSEWFIGEVGKHYSDVLFSLDKNILVNTSKKVGWNNENT